jgi:hypothetical protein
MRLPVRFEDDRARAEQILLDSAKRHALSCERLGPGEAERLEDRFGIKVGEIEPRVYWRITDNWLELTIRFLAPDHGTREIKDRMSREILAALQEAKMGIASATYEIVGVPPITLESKTEPQT